MKTIISPDEPLPYHWVSGLGSLGPPKASQAPGIQGSPWATRRTRDPKETPPAPWGPGIQGSPQGNGKTECRFWPQTQRAPTRSSQTKRSVICDVKPAPPPGPRTLLFHWQTTAWSMLLGIRFLEYGAWTWSTVLVALRLECGSWNKATMRIYQKQIIT